MSLKALALFLLLVCLPVLADPLLVDGGLEEAKPAWTAQGGYGTVATFAQNPGARSGARCVRLRTFEGLRDRYASIAQETAALPAGLYELTAWSKGTGKLRLAVKGMGMRRFQNTPAAWAQYSYVFELPTARTVTVGIEVQGDALVDDIALVPADDALRAAWERQQEAFARLNYVPSGYSAQRSAPGAPAQPVVDRQPVPITDKVVFYDPRYDNSWNTNCDRFAEWFSRRGFAVKGAVELAAWMTERIGKGAYGSAAVMSMGLAPQVLITPLDDTCLLRRYLDAGGRVVWTGNTALYCAQDETGPVYNPGEAGMGEVLYLTCDWGIWSQRPPELTAAGKRWGLQQPGSSLRAARRSEVTLSLSDDPGGEGSAIWLATTNPAYPLSGFIASVYGLDGDNTAALEDFYRMALYTGEPVTIPPPTALPAAPTPPFTIALSAQAGGAPRRAFTRREQIALTARLAAAATPAEARRVRLRLTGGAPSFSAYDLAVLGLTDAWAQVAGYQQRVAKLPALWTKTIPATWAEGRAGTVATGLDAGALPVGDYLVRADLLRPDGAVAASAELPLAICPAPRLDDVYFGARGPLPANPYRLAGYLEVLRGLGLRGIEGGSSGAGALDNLLREGITTVPHLEPRRYLTELKKDKEGNDVPNPWGGGKPGLLGLAGAKARENALAGVTEEARGDAAHPACSRVFTTADDFSALGGADYTPANLQEFRAKTGREAPRAPTAARGVVPDEDPWLQWCMFLSRDVLGGLNDAIRRGVEAGAPGGTVWPVPGGAQWPLFSVYSGQYPPANFGKEHGYNALGHYCYLGYWAPSLKYLYWSEIARMGNRDLPLWCMPDAGNVRHYQRNQAHLLLAGNTKGLVYFCYEWMGPEGRQEIAELGRLTQVHGPLLRRLQPAPKAAALLVPFTQSCYADGYPLQASNAFDNLLLAKVDAEVLAEEEIAASKHRVILLAGITHLRASSVQALQAYLQRGGVVLLDRDCTVDVPGATKLALSLISPGDVITSYALPEQAAALRAALAPYLKPALDSPELTTIVRPFTSTDGSRYVYVVQVDTQEEYGFYRHNAYEPAVFGKEAPESAERMKQFYQEHGMINNLQDTAMTVVFEADLLPAGGQVVDVYSGAVLTPAPAGEGKLAVRVTTRRFGGTLLAFRPVPVARVLLTAPRSLKRGEAGVLQVSVVGAQGRPLPGAFGLQLRIANAAGQEDRELSGYYAADRGRLSLPFHPALYSAAGTWTVEATELSSKQSSRVTVVVK